MRQMATFVPKMVQAEINNFRQSQRNEQKFWGRWAPAGLKQDQHAPLLQKYAPLYRQANPKATLDQMVEDLGPIIIAASGVKPGTAARAPNGAGSRVPASPFKPAQGGPAAVPQQEAEDPWAGLNPQNDTGDD